MKQNYELRTVILFIVSIISISAPACAQEWQSLPLPGEEPKPPSFTLSITGAPTVSAGSDVFVDVTIKNKSDRDLPLTFAGWGIDVWDDKGATPPGTQYARSLRRYETVEDAEGLDYVVTGKLVHSSLGKGKSFTSHVNISVMYDLGHPGKYTIQLHRSDGESWNLVESNKITVTIVPGQAPAAGLAQSKSALFSVAIDTPQATLKIGSVIRVNIVLTNTTYYDIQISREMGERGELDYTLDVSDSAGHVPTETEYYLAVQGKQGPKRPMLVILRSGGFALLKPRETLTESIELDKLYELDKPDEYTIQLERIDNDTKVLVKSNTLTVTLTP